MTLKVLDLLLWIRNDCISTRSPISRADFPMFIRILESLNKSQSLIYGSSDWQIIHRNLSQNSLVVDDKQATEAVAIVLQENSIIL